MMGEVRAFYDFDISDDFKRVAIISRITSTNDYVLTTLIYDNVDLGYKVS